MMSFRGRSISGLILSNVIVAMLVAGLFYTSLLVTSAPVNERDIDTVHRAIAILESKGFDREVYMLRNTALFRGTDHWFNDTVLKEDAYAATNFPFQIVTVYNDFYTKAVDDTERAMILLHESRHLLGEDEAAAYSYVWQNRERLGWTQLTHGTTESYVTIEQQTRENAPELFTCTKNLWNDCTLRHEPRE